MGTKAKFQYLRNSWNFFSLFFIESSFRVSLEVIRYHFRSSSRRVMKILLIISAISAVSSSQILMKLGKVLEIIESENKTPVLCQAQLRLLHEASTTREPSWANQSEIDSIEKETYP
jgi:hypothetical protein